MSSTISCLICRLELQKMIHVDMSGDLTQIECERCGKYTITRPARLEIAARQPGHKLIAWIREMHERGADPAKITSNVLENIEGNIPDYTPTQKQLILLQNIERSTPFPGRAVSISPKVDYPLAWATNEEELVYYLRCLHERGLLRLSAPNDRFINELLNSVEITAAGWDFLEKNSYKPAISSQAFVAMSFSDELKTVWENGFKKAVERAGYVAYRIDSEPHADRIDVKIMAEIKNSRVLIADVTEQKRGVYFEAGYALGLGVPVLWSCRKDDLKNAHFDTNHYNHILWENEGEIEEKLYDFICAIIGKGPRSEKTYHSP
jgi:nucleoside 2-deoxyribosyltransferase